MSKYNQKISNITDIFAQSKVIVCEFIKDVKGIHEMFSLQESMNNIYVRNRYLSLLEKVNLLSTQLDSVCDELISTNLEEFNANIKKCLDIATGIKAYCISNISFGKKPISGMKQTDTEIFNEHVTKVIDLLNNTHTISMKQKSRKFIKYGKYIKRNDTLSILVNKSI